MQEEFILGNADRTQPMSRRANTLPSEELISSGGLRYSYLWDWAKLPAWLQGVDFRGIALDSRGFVLAAANVPGCSVAVFDPEGNYAGAIGTPEQTGRVHGVSVDARDRVWLTSLDRHVALLYDRAGNLLRALGRYDTPSDSGVNDLCLPSRWRWHTIRRLAGPFHQPTRLVEGPGGALFAADGYGNAAIHRFAPDGALQQSWGGMGTQPGQFTIPHSVHADGAGRIWVADCEADRVQVFTPEGGLIACLDGLLYPLDVTSDSQFIYVAEREGRISVYDYPLTLRAQLGYYGSVLTAHSLAADGRGNVYFSSLWSGVGLCKLARLDNVEGGGAL